MSADFKYMFGPDHEITWVQAASWVRNKSLRGGGWRMPNINELKILYENDEEIRGMPWWVWSGEVENRDGYDTALFLDFRNGKVFGYQCNWSNPRHRAIAVGGVL